MAPPHGKNLFNITNIIRYLTKSKFLKVIPKAFHAALLFHIAPPTNIPVKKLKHQLGIRKGLNWAFGLQSSRQLIF